MKNIIFFGPPGAGKGTQAKIVSKYFNISHLSTGDILRKKLLDEDELAEELKSIMSSGNLVSDEILNSIVASRLKNEKDKGFILDGYPRTLHQSEFLNNFLSETSSSINYIFDIQINFETLKNRILKRSSEESREDDNINVIETRYNEYLNSTQKVSNFYKDKYKTIFYEIDGSLEIEEITQNIKQILKTNGYDPKYNVVLKSSDKIIVPRKDNTIEITGAVQQSSAVTYSKSMTTISAINRAGGFSENAKKNSVYVVYQNGNIASTKSFLIFNNYPKLKPGAKVVVPEKNIVRNKTSVGEIVGYTTSLVSIIALLKSL